MSKRPLLQLIDGGVTQEERSIYRLRPGRPQGAPAEASWPKDGEWRKLIHRLMRNPVKA